MNGSLNFKTLHLMNTRILTARLLVCLCVCSTTLLGGCASIINGSKQTVKINSQPAGASVKIDGDATGVTPAKVELSRKTSHLVAITLNGYKPYEITLEPHFNGLTLGNILIGGIIGMAIDGSTGAGNTLQPEEVNPVLQKVGR